MAIHVNCPHCHERLTEINTVCTHCEAALPPGVLYALSAALGESPPPMQPMHHMPTHLAAPAAPPPASPSHPPVSPPARRGSLRPWLAAALSLVCGLGQLYNGQIVKGMILIILGTAAVASIQLPIGKMMLPLLLLYATIDAYVVARRANS
jgi:TM2 domain-containing membrane protein YozV